MLAMHDLSIPGLAALWLVGANALALGAFALDKACARAGRRRISEARLLQFALLGGTPGTYAGRHLFRHKTRKEPFSSRLHTIAILQAAALTGLGVFLMP